MADDTTSTMPAVAPTSALADTNARLLTQVTGSLLAALGTNSSAVVTVINSIAAAITTNVLTILGNKTITGGFRTTDYNGGTISTGTFTPDAYNSNYQFYTNNGAHTLAAPANNSAIDILITNGASAGAITFSGYTVGSNTGSALTTTNGNRFIISIRRINGVSTYSSYALQ